MDGRSSAICEPSAPPVWSDDDITLSEWGITRQQQWGLAQNVEIGDDPTSCFRKVIRVRYPAGSASPTAVRHYGCPLGGAQFLATCGLVPSDERRLRYYVRFFEDFQFALGGKLPGLCGGHVFSGGRVPDGTNGFSTRYMWREHGDGELYLYSPRCSRFGDSIGSGAWRFVPGRWYCLEQHVVLNTPGLADGRVRVCVDGRQVLDAADLLFRTVSTLQITAICFSTFFGGGDPSWASPISTAADFAGFAQWNPRP
jgi:hypothetical protein